MNEQPLKSQSVEEIMLERLMENAVQHERRRIAKFVLIAFQENLPVETIIQAIKTGEYNGHLPPPSPIP